MRALNEFIEAMEVNAVGYLRDVLDRAMSVDWPTSFEAMDDLTEYTARRDGVLFGQRVA